MQGSAKWTAQYDVPLCAKLTGFGFCGGFVRNQQATESRLDEIQNKFGLLSSSKILRDSIFSNLLYDHIRINHLGTLYNFK